MSDYDIKDECISVEKLMKNSTGTLKFKFKKQNEHEIEDEDDFPPYIKKLIDETDLKIIDNVPLERTFKYIGETFKIAFEIMFDKNILNNKTLCVVITCRDGAWNVLYFKEGLLYHIYLDCHMNEKLTCHGYKQIFDLSSIKHYLNPYWKMDYELGRYDNYGSSPEISDKDFYESLSPKQQDFLKNTVYFSEMNMPE